MNMIEIEKPASIAVIGEEVGGVSAVVLHHDNGFEPAIRHGLDGSFWISEIPWRLSIQDAMQFARRMAGIAFEPGLTI